MRENPTDRDTQADRETETHTERQRDRDIYKETDKRRDRGKKQRQIQIQRGAFEECFGLEATFSHILSHSIIILYNPPHFTAFSGILPHSTHSISYPGDIARGDNWLVFGLPWNFIIYNTTVLCLRKSRSNRLFGKCFQSVDHP